MNTRYKNCIWVLFLLSTVTASAQFSIGADVFSRYIWRGTDFGNAASVQPFLSYSIQDSSSLIGFEAGVWSSWAISSPDANENDLYMTVSAGPVGLTVTDYYFPAEPGGVFDYEDEKGTHFLEAMLTYARGPFSIFGGYFFSGDPGNSAYVEAAYEFYQSGDVAATISIGGGNEIYVVDASGDFNLVNIALGVSKGAYAASYIINPESEVSYLVFGISF